MNIISLTIRELKSIDEWKFAFPVIKQLRTRLNELEYINLLKIMYSE